ncbi:MAG: hypothetical protein EOP35_13145, partial [Rubrivivax sp.]
APARAAATPLDLLRGNAANTATITLPIGISAADAMQALTLATLRHYGHQKERTAAVLGISLKTLYNRLKEYSTGDKASSTDDGARYGR